MTATLPNPALPGLADLRRDTRGAVMLTGLFMSCFLIGALWFVVGIGDTVVFRDKMQEAADHGAFASAALHAKGMNFISLCNLVLLAAVTIHIILGIIHDIALAICIVSIGFSCGFWLSMRKVYTGYFKVLKPAAKAIHVAELVASYGYPVMGVVEGMQVGSSYGGGRGTSKVLVLPLSSSIVPGGGKEGLPVEARPMNYLCKKIVNVVGTQLFNKALGVSTKSPGGKALNLAKKLIGSVIEFRYCNDLGSGSGGVGQGGISDALGEGNGRVDEENAKIDDANANRKQGDPVQDRIEKAKTGGSTGGGIDPGFDKFWGNEGPLVVFGKGSNGSDYFQTYAANLGPSMNDMSESRVGVARGPKLGMAKYTKTQGTLGYFAQAEFYFDCEEAWDGVNCNYEDNATFQIKWRARLRRLNLASVVNTGLNALQAIPKIQKVAEKVQEIFNEGIPGQGDMGTLKDVLQGNPDKGIEPVINVYH